VKLWILLPLIALLLAACSQDQIGDTIETASGLQYEVLASGNGESPASGDTAVVHYTGWLTDGTKFDSSVDRGQPFEFGVGQGNVIKGWDEGVALMKVGDKWKFTIPPELAYGKRNIGNGLIPPNSTLVFEVELLDVK
jgi:FKBP-type peptidyl-prolyl cis-trans isomerase